MEFVRLPGTLLVRITARGRGDALRKSCYFGVGRIMRDQVRDYARRKGFFWPMHLLDAERLDRSLLDGVFCRVPDIGGERFLLCTSAVLLFWCWPDHARPGAGLCTTQRMEFGICGKMVATQFGLCIAGTGLLRCADNDASSGGELCGTYAPKSADGVPGICAWRRLAQPGVDCRAISWNSSGSRVPCLSGSQREGDVFCTCWTPKGTQVFA